MATEKAVNNPAVKEIERTRSMNWASWDGKPIRCEAQREVLRLDAGDKVVYGPHSGATVGRSYDRVRDETVDVNGKTISVADIAAAQGAFVDRWRAEDLVPPEPPPEGRR